MVKINNKIDKQSIEKSRTPKGFNLSTMPRFNYFVIDNLELSIGADYIYDFMWQEYVDKNNKSYLESDIASFGTGLHYFVKITDVFYYTPGFNFSIGGGTGTFTTKTSIAGQKDEDKTNVGFPIDVFLQLDFGKFEFRVSEKIGIDVSLLCLSLDYLRMTVKDNDFNAKYITGSTDFRFDINYGLRAGVKYYF